MKEFKIFRFEKEVNGNNIVSYSVLTKNKDADGKPIYMPCIFSKSIENKPSSHVIMKCNDGDAFVIDVEYEKNGIKKVVKKLLIKSYQDMKILESKNKLTDYFD